MDGIAFVQRAADDDAGAEAGAFPEGTGHSFLGEALEIAARRAGSVAGQEDLADGELVAEEICVRDAAGDQVAAMFAVADGDGMICFHAIEGFGGDESDFAEVARIVVAEPIPVALAD